MPGARFEDDLHGRFIGAGKRDLDMPCSLVAPGVECPRHGSLFDLKTGKPKTLPAFQPVRTFPVSISNDEVILEV